jgi:hypothetical protein
VATLALTRLAVLIAVPIAGCGKSAPPPPAKESGADLRAQLERVLAAVPPTDAPEQKCPDAEIAKHAGGMAKDVVLVHIDRLRELTGKKAASGSGDGLVNELRKSLSNNLLEGMTLESHMLAELIEQRPWLLVTQPLSASAASGTTETGDQRTFVGGSAAVRISLHEPGTGRALCWTVAKSGSSERVVAVAGSEDDNVKRDLEANIFMGIGPALATITTALTVRNPPWI